MRRAAGGLVPPGTDVAAVRISAPGWENAVLDGLQVPRSCQSSRPRHHCQTAHIPNATGVQKQEEPARRSSTVVQSPAIDVRVTKCVSAGAD